MKHNSVFERLRSADSPINQYLLVQCERKWNLFGGEIEWKDKTVLDVGCTEGHSCVEAIARGAKSCLGLEMFKRYLEDGRRVIAELGMEERIHLQQCQWPEVFVVENFDIVLALGLLHHIRPERLEEAVRKLCWMSRGILVLENRVDVGELSDYVRLELKQNDAGVEIPVTVPSDAWLVVTLISEDFDVSKRFTINEGKREIWVCRKT